ncbi:MAG TPA: MFS transporter [Candidatus Angelobacter sp.]|nr:MFS transporter [Candidatus Angelobacter sp.]
MAHASQLAAVRRDAVVLALASMAIFLNTVDISILNVAMPVIQRDLGISTTLLQWLQGAYGLSYAGLLLLSGRLADLAGRRRVFLTGVGLFGAASLAGTIAPGIALLLAARALQGVGAALMVPSAISIISTTFAEGRRRNHALGIFSAVAASGFSSGLAAGALITEFVSWRWVFFVNVPIAAAILALTLCAVARDGASRRASVDVAGAALVTAGLLAIVYAIPLFGGSTRSLASALEWSALGATLLGAFALYERRLENPLVPLSLFAQPSLRAASAASIALLGSAFGFFFLASMCLQTAAGYSSLEAGFALLPMSLISACVSLLVAPRLAGLIGAGRMLGLGLVLNAVGLSLFVMADPPQALAMTILASVVLGGFGMGLGYPATNLVALEGMEPGLQGAASGIQNTSLQAGGAIGTAIAAAALSAFGTPFAAVASADQITARSLAALMLAAFALAGALALVALRRSARTATRQCVESCPTP